MRYLFGNWTEVLFCGDVDNKECIWRAGMWACVSVNQHNWRTFSLTRAIFDHSNMLFIYNSGIAKYHMYTLILVKICNGIWCLYVYVWYLLSMIQSYLLMYACLWWYRVWMLCRDITRLFWPLLWLHSVCHRAKWTDGQPSWKLTNLWHKISSWPEVKYNH